jgi:hypothetical protein
MMVLMDTIKKIIPSTSHWFQKDKTTASSATIQGPALSGDSISSPAASNDVRKVLSNSVSGQDRFKDAKELLRKNPWGPVSSFSSLTSIPKVERRLMLVTRWEHSPYYDRKQNDFFALRSAQDIEKVARKIRDGAVTTFDQLWKMARASRIATLTKRERKWHTRAVEFESFARCRNSARVLSMQGQYGYIIRNLDDQFKSIVRDMDCAAQEQEDDEYYYYRYLRDLEENEKRKPKDDSNLSTSASGRHITISETGSSKIMAVLWQDPPGALVGDSSRVTKSMGHFKMEVSPLCRSNWLLWHEDIDQETYTKTVLKIHQQYQEALAATTPEKTLKEAFRAYRTSVRAMLDERGTAAKSHFCLQSILLSRGIVLSPAKEGLAPDLECFASTEDEWVNDRAWTIFQIQHLAPNVDSSQQKDGA